MSHGHEVYGKIKYKIKAGLYNEIRGTKIFAKKKLILDSKNNSKKETLELIKFEKKVNGCCFISHGFYRLFATISTEKCIIGKPVIINIAVDTTNASTDIKNIYCELVMITTIKANNKTNQEKKVIYSVEFGKIKKGESRVDQNAFSIKVNLNGEEDIPASTNGTLVTNKFIFISKAFIDGWVYFDKAPISKTEINVLNKEMEKSIIPFDDEWDPQVFDSYSIQLNDNQFKMNDTFKKYYKPMKNYDEDDNLN